jgi:hypothetical protein
MYGGQSMAQAAEVKAHMVKALNIAYECLVASNMAVKPRQNIVYAGAELT